MVRKWKNAGKKGAGYERRNEQKRNKLAGTSARGKRMTEGEGKPDSCLGRSRKKRRMGGGETKRKKNRLAVGAIEEFKRRQECPGQSLEQPAYHAGQ